MGKMSTGLKRRAGYGLALAACVWLAGCASPNLEESAVILSTREKLESTFKGENIKPDLGNVSNCASHFKRINSSAFSQFQNDSKKHLTIKAYKQHLAMLSRLPKPKLGERVIPTYKSWKRSMEAIYCQNAFLHAEPEAFFDVQLVSAFSNENTKPVTIDIHLVQDTSSTPALWRIDREYNSTGSYFVSRIINQLLEILAKDRAVYIGDRHENNISAIIGFDSNFSERYVTFQTYPCNIENPPPKPSCQSALISVPLFKYDSMEGRDSAYVKNSLRFNNAKTKLKACPSNTSEFKVKVLPVSDWGRKLLNGSTSAQIAACITNGHVYNNEFMEIRSLQWID